MKLCECGCGQPAPIAKQTNAKLGHVKGEPVRFINHHAQRSVLRGARHVQWKGGRSLSASGYQRVKAYDHPRADHGHQVLEHVVIAERALGHALPPKAQIHHVNEIRIDNRNANLVICEDARYHRLLHMRAEAYRATGNPSSRKCYFCGEWDADFIPAQPKRGAYHRACSAKARKAHRQQEGSHETPTYS